MPTEKPITSPDLVRIAQTHVGLFRAEEARRWAKINSYQDVITLRAEDPAFLSQIMPLRTQKRNGVLVTKLGEDYYKVGDMFARIKENGQYLLSFPHEGTLNLYSQKISQ